MMFSDDASLLFDAWRSKGRSTEIGGRRIFYVDSHGDREPAGGAGEDGEAVLVLHGFPSSSLDFHRVLPELGRRRRVILHDHLGFGFSAKPAGYSYSLLEQAEVAMELWRRLGVSRAHLLAHDYGTSVATEVLARRERGGIPVELSSVTLTNGSMLLELAELRLSQRLARSKIFGPIFARLVFRGYFKRVMRRLWGDPEDVDEVDLEVMWRGIRHANGQRRVPRISGYLDERIRFRNRFIGALERFDRPVHLLWGRRDPVAVAAIAERLAELVPTARATWLDELGHYPMLEDPEAFASAFDDFLELASR